MVKFYKKLKTTTFFLLLMIASFSGSAQRISSFNNIGWFSANGNIKISEKVTFLSELHWRRTDFITYGQQAMTRDGFQYNFDKKAAVALLYAYALTYPYGDYPAGPYTIPEHRITEQLTWSNNTGRFNFSNRIRLEQRWIGRINQKGTTGDVEDWVYMNRVRYMLRADFPITRPKLEDKTWYTATYDEIFVGFGKNINQAVFDQNRFGLVLGYKFNKHMRLEGGYFCQILQQNGLVDNREVFQYNQGPILNYYLTY